MDSGLAAAANISLYKRIEEKNRKQREEREQGEDCTSMNVNRYMYA